MKGRLKDYYITTSMIARHWNKNGYLTEKGTHWNADKVGKKFRKILDDVEGTIGSDGNFKNLYRSKNSEAQDSPFIFFDAGEIIEYKKMIYDASLSEHMLLFKKLPAYADDYETDTYDSLKCIFGLCNQAGGVKFLTSNEIEILGKKLENLVPMCRDIDKLEEVLSKVNPEDKKSYRDLLPIEEFEENKQMVRSYINQFHIETRKNQFYKKRIFIKEHYVKNGQIDCLKEWVEKWTYVIDHMVSIYRKSGERKLDVNNVLKVLLIWYQNKKREEIILDYKLKRRLEVGIKHVLKEKGKWVKNDLMSKVTKILKEYSDEEKFKQKGFDVENIKTFSSKEVAETLKTWVSTMTDYRKSEFDLKSEDDYFFVIKQAFEDLETICENVIERTKAIEKAKQKDTRLQRFEQNGEKDVLPYLLECIEILEPHIDRISMIPDKGKNPKTE